jgi:hypothetical protein
MNQTPSVCSWKAGCGDKSQVRWTGDHTIAELAELFSVSRATIYREIARARQNPCRPANAGSSREPNRVGAWHERHLDPGTALVGKKRSLVDWSTCAGSRGGAGGMAASVWFTCRASVRMGLGRGRLR